MPTSPFMTSPDPPPFDRVVALPPVSVFTKLLPSSESERSLPEAFGRAGERRQAENLDIVVVGQADIAHFGQDRIGAAAGQLMHFVVKVVDVIDVIARAAGHRVFAETADKPVVACATLQDVVHRAAIQGVVAGAAIQDVEVAAAGQRSRCRRGRT